MTFVDIVFKKKRKNGYRPTTLINMICHILILLCWAIHNSSVSIQHGRCSGFDAWWRPLWSDWFIFYLFQICNIIKNNSCSVYETGPTKYKNIKMKFNVGWDLFIRGRTKLVSPLFWDKYDLILLFKN